MIAALGQHGHGLQAIVLFEQMLKEYIVPELITFSQFSPLLAMLV